MGLDTSHDAFHGAYSAFNRFRQAVAKAIGGSFPFHDDTSLDNKLWYWGDGYGKESHPGLHCFFMHEDCDGEISPEDCARIADELEPLLPEIDEMGMGGGHIESQGGYGSVTRKFIAGCRLAAESNETLVFQ